MRRTPQFVQVVASPETAVPMTARRFSVLETPVLIANPAGVVPELARSCSGAAVPLQSCPPTMRIIPVEMPDPNAVNIARQNPPARVLSVVNVLRPGTSVCTPPPQSAETVSDDAVATAPRVSVRN